MKDFVIKKADIIIVCVLVIISILPLFVFATESFENKDRYAVIYVDGKKYKEVKLGEDLFYEIETEQARGYNLIVIDGYDITMKEADCFDQICVRQGIIFKIGQSIVCLPNRVFIEITGKEPPEIDDISR